MKFSMTVNLLANRFRRGFLDWSPKRAGCAAVPSLDASCHSRVSLAEMRLDNITMVGRVRSREARDKRVRSDCVLQLSAELLSQVACRSDFLNVVT
jgi:hypothetical protein